ncbi:MAG: putative Ig domain-containing protein [Bryobacteraceae bacterium]
MRTRLAQQMKSKLILAASLMSLAMTMPSWAQTIQLSDGTNTYEVDASGTITYSGTICASGCGLTAVTSTPGVISVSGTIGVFTVQTSGTELGTAPNNSFDLSTTITAVTGSPCTLQPASGANCPTLTISFSATGLQGTGPFAIGANTKFYDSTNTLSSTVGNVAYTGYASSTNVALATGTAAIVIPTTNVANGDPLILGPSSITVDEPFSMTLVEAISMEPGSTFNAGDASMGGTSVTPLTVACPSVTAASVGTSYSSLFVASGGVMPYTYSVANAGTGILGLPPGLSFSSTTGTITGTPTGAGGTYTFEGKVVDKENETATTSVCSIVVAPPQHTTGGNPPPALKVQCPSSKATVGTFYSSEIVLTGGTAPYEYAIIGSLPDGLTLTVGPNANSPKYVAGTFTSSPVYITGTPAKDAETGSFKIEVTDSEKPAVVAYSNCSGSCSLGTTVTWGGVQGYGQGQCGTSKTYTSNGKSLTVCGYDTHGNKCNLSSNSDWSDGSSALGISNWGNQNQIDTDHFVQCQLPTSHVNGATISVGTADTGWGGGWGGNATYDIYGSNTDGELGTCLKSNVNADSSFQEIPKCTSYKYINIKAHQGDCQIKSIQVNYPCNCAIDVGECSQGSKGGQPIGGGKCQIGGGHSSGGQNTGQCGW